MIGKKRKKIEHLEKRRFAGRSMKSEAVRQNTDFMALEVKPIEEIKYWRRERKVKKRGVERKNQWSINSPSGRCSAGNNEIADGLGKSAKKGKINPQAEVILKEKVGAARPRTRQELSTKKMPNVTTGTADLLKVGRGEERK